MVSLSTPRLLLRECTIDDLSALYELDSDPEVERYITYEPSTLEECQSDLIFHINEQSASPRSSYYLVVTLRAEGRFIGWCVLDITNQKHREAEIGYALNRHDRGKGYIPEAVQALLSFGFDTLKLHRIFAACEPENSASERVLQKVGMQKEGYLRGHKWVKGKWRDSLLYAILAHD